jgi:hypothetical protein
MLTNKLRKLLHRKQLEMVTPSPYAIGNGCFFASSAELGRSSSRADNAVYLVANTASIARYTPQEDAWSFLPASGMAGVFGTGACGDAMRLGMLNGLPTHTATAGTTTALVTTANIKGVLTGSTVRVVAGAGAGYVGSVAVNTVGANSVLTVSPASATAFNSTTVFQLFSGSLWVFCPGTTAVGFAVYDNATNTWTQKSVTGLPMAWTTTGQLRATSAAATGNLALLAGSTATTVPVSGVTWELNAFANYQIRIASGTGAGQIRKITSNTTAGVVTVTPAWTTTPDATSVAVIEADEDAIYLGGNGSATLYRYSIAANTWTTMAPTVARGGATGAGATFHWVGTVDGWPLGGTGFWQRGRYIYSLRGGGTSVTTFDVYDIALNAWSVRDYAGRGAQVYSTGTCSAMDGRGRMLIQHDASGRIYAFDLAANELHGLTTNLYPQSSVANANLMFVVPYIDGAERLDFLYTGRHSGTEMHRMLLV